MKKKFVYISTELKDPFLLLAQRLPTKEYQQITEIMYSLFMGNAFGYEEEDVLGMLRDIKTAQKEVALEKRSSFTVIEGGKFSKKRKK
jgi:hypothetical protein|tara:strand:- start:152 stop:415 length:264 start_codon:yes stop_codon:yes gene_type:complete